MALTVTLLLYQLLLRSQVQSPLLLPLRKILAIVPQIRYNGYMIVSLSGTLIDIHADYVVVDVNGVGYQVFIPELIQRELPALKESVFLHTVHHIREDHQQLYGFLDVGSRDLFLTLTTVSGLGPKLGIKILSSIRPEQLVPALLNKDLHILTQISGIGKKMAEKMLIELPDKVAALPPQYRAGTQAQSPSGPSAFELEQDLFMALKALGYTQQEIKRSYQKAADQLGADTSLEAGVKVLLKHL